MGTVCRRVILSIDENTRFFQFFKSGKSVILHLGFKDENDNFRAEFYTKKEKLLMDRHPQQIKRKRQDKKKHEKNISDLSRLRNAVKSVLAATQHDEAEKLYKVAVSTIDKAAGNGLIKKNTAARRKSRITRHLNSLA